jgi:hypothetical protein
VFRASRISVFMEMARLPTIADSTMMVSITSTKAMPRREFCL